MWALNNKTPYAAERTWIRDRTGAHHWVVAVKATFDIRPDGKLSLADQQTPLLLAPEFWGEPGASSVRFEADVVPPKPTTDILVEGTAHSPDGRPTTKLPVSLRIADVEKTIVVHGPRVYYRGADGRLTTSASAPFTTRPIRYEDAYGGSDFTDPDPRRQKIDTRNPVGKGVAADPGRLINQPAHSVEYPDGDLEKRGPAGFSPIASFWSPRLECAGTYDKKWEEKKKPLLPDDYDENFLLCAPRNQRPTRHLRGEEPAALVNLRPEGTLRFRLPRIFLTFSTRFGRRKEEHRSRLGTVLIEPDAKQVKLVWQTSLMVRPNDSDYLDETRIDEKAYLT
jgi:hypothetical protein